MSTQCDARRAQSDGVTYVIYIYIYRLFRNIAKCRAHNQVECYLPAHAIVYQPMCACATCECIYLYKRSSLYAIYSIHSYYVGMVVCGRCCYSLLIAAVVNGAGSTGSINKPFESFRARCLCSANVCTCVDSLQTPGFLVQSVGRFRFCLSPTTRVSEFLCISLALIVSVLCSPFHPLLILWYWTASCSYRSAPYFRQMLAKTEPATSFSSSSFEKFFHIPFL